jgi:hypothetical protein
MELSAAIDKAIANLHQRCMVKSHDQEFEVRSLVPYSQWRPISEPWWKKKEACVIGEDSCGNYYLCVCDGSVRFWDHETGDDQLLFSSVRDFLTALSPPSPVELKPGQVLRGWIDPAFLEEQRKENNA